MKQMNRKINTLFLLMVLFVAACSKLNTEGQESGRPGLSDPYIFFEAGILDVTETKANLITSLPTANGTAFGVIGYYGDGASIFSAYANGIARVYREGSLYKYDNLASWQGTNHTFHAFYPYNGLVVSKNDSGTPYVDYTQPLTEDSMTDILGTCQAVTHTANTKPVQLHFQHLLWAFELSITNSQTLEVKPDGTTIENPSITITKITFTITDFPKTASLYLNSGYTVTPSTTPITQSYPLYSSTTGDTLTSGQSKTWGPLLFIPVTGLKYQVTIEYTTPGGVQDRMVYPAEGQYKSVTPEGGFKRGTRYNLSINKANDKFFEVKGFKPADWESKNVDHEFN